MSHNQLQLAVLRTTMGVKVEVPEEEYTDLKRQAKQQGCEHIVPLMCIEKEFSEVIIGSIQNLCRGWIIILTSTHCVYESLSLLFPRSEKHMMVNCIYAMNSLTIISLVTLSFRRPKYFSIAVYLAYILCQCRIIIRVVDLEETKESMGELDFNNMVLGQYMKFTALI